MVGRPGGVGKTCPGGAAGKGVGAVPAAAFCSLGFYCACAWMRKFRFVDSFGACLYNTPLVVICSLLAPLGLERGKQKVENKMTIIP